MRRIGIKERPNELFGCGTPHEVPATGVEWGMHTLGADICPIAIVELDFGRGRLADQLFGVRRAERGVAAKQDISDDATRWSMVVKK